MLGGFLTCVLVQLHVVLQKYCKKNTTIDTKYRRVNRNLSSTLSMITNEKVYLYEITKYLI